jgi:hypothetical protein
LDVGEHLQRLDEGKRAAAALQHFQTRGYREGRIYKRVPLVLGWAALPRTSQGPLFCACRGESLPLLPPLFYRYVSFGGLTNQMYGHTSAMTLAAALGCGLIIPPGVVRNGYDKVYSNRAEANEMHYTYSAFGGDGGLFDEATITGYLRGARCQPARLGCRLHCCLAAAAVRWTAQRLLIHLTAVTPCLPPPHRAAQGVSAKVLSPQLASGMAQHFNQLHKLPPSTFDRHHLRHAQLLFPQSNASHIRVVNLGTNLFAKGAELQVVVRGSRSRLVHVRSSPHASWLQKAGRLAGADASDAARADQARCMRRLARSRGWC